jgi:hypothetical protein
MIELEIDPPIMLYGDIMVQFKSVGSINQSNLFRITFNTAFVESENKLKLSRWNISPENLHKDFTKFEADFNVIMDFEDYCHGLWDSEKNQFKRVPCQSHVTELD